MSPRRPEPLLSIDADVLRGLRLRRLHLDRRAAKARMLDVVTATAGVHAQVMSAAELSLAARVNGLRRADVQAALWQDRTFVKTWAMRGTLHLLRSDELALYSAALSTFRQWHAAYWRKAFDVREGDVERIVEAITDVLDGDPLTREELIEAVAPKVGTLAEHLRSGWGTFLKPAARLGRLCFGPSRGRNVTFTRPDRWLGPQPAVEGEEALRELARRFLRSYGPARHEDFARWFGADPPFARRLFSSMQEELAPVETAGRPAWALGSELAGLRRASPTEVVRLLPHFDVYTLFFEPREVAVAKPHAGKVFRKGAWVSPVVLVDGLANGVWELDAGRIEIRPFARVRAAARGEIEAEALRLGRFLGPEGLAVDWRA